MISRKFPTASRRSKTASTSSTPTASARDGSICTSSWIAPARQAAKLFGLFPRKGAIAVGSDADLVVYDPDYRGKISAKTHLLNIDYSAFEGWEIKGRPHVVTVRGEVATKAGKFTGKIGRGRLLKREPTHF